jgi:proline iminopeptidase
MSNFERRRLIQHASAARCTRVGCGRFVTRTTQARAIAAVALMWLVCATSTHAAGQESGSASASGFADIAGARLYYEIAGNGAPVVLIHGNAGDRRHWDAQFSALAGEFRVIRYDARGYGRSSTPAEGMPYADHEDLAALLDHVGAAQAHVVGWSMGAAIAVDFAIQFPNRTLSVTAVGPWIAGYSSSAANDVYAGLAKVAIAAQRRGRDAAVKAFMEAPFFAATSRDPSARGQFERIAASYSFWAFAHRDPRRTLDPPAAARLSEIHTPMLIVIGEHDIPACLEISALLDESVRDSTKMVLPGAGHLVHMERPEPFNTVLARFIRTADAANAPAARGVIPANPFELRYQIEGRGRPAIVIGSVHPQDYTLDLVIDDIEQARRRLGLDRVAVIGHSGQAYMALEYAKRHPEHVSHSIMIGIAPDLSEASAAAAERYWQDFASAERKALLHERRRTLPDSQLEKLEPGTRFIQTYGIRDSPRSWYRLDFDPAPLWSGVEINMDVFGYLWGDVFRSIDITRGLDRFDRPVFIALGRHDFAIAPPSSWDPIVPKLQDVTVRIFEQSGHTPQYEEAELFDAELLKWMEARR